MRSLTPISANCTLTSGCSSSRGRRTWSPPEKTRRAASRIVPATGVQPVHRPEDHAAQREWNMLRGMRLATALGVLMAGCVAARADGPVPVKIGVLNDRSGVYSDISGEGSVVAARMALEDFKPAEHGLKVEIVSADHQNKPDVGSAIARQWYDRDGIDVIMDVVTSSVALAINQVTREKNKVHINSGAG